jgi:hypothetical protein
VGVLSREGVGGKGVHRRGGGIGCPGVAGFAPCTIARFGDDSVRNVGEERNASKMGAEQAGECDAFSQDDVL